MEVQRRRVRVNSGFASDLASCNLQMFILVLLEVNKNNRKQPRRGWSKESVSWTCSDGVSRLLVSLWLDEVLDTVG